MKEGKEKVTRQIKMNFAVLFKSVKNTAIVPKRYILIETKTTLFLVGYIFVTMK